MLIDYTRADYVCIDLAAADRDALLSELAAPLLKDQKTKIANLAMKTLREREDLGSTAMGFGVAIPHGRIEQFPEVRLGIGLHREGIEFGAQDGQPVHLFFLILAPIGAPEHLKILAQIGRICQEEDIRTRLSSAQDPEELLEILRAFEAVL